ncbi:hypothetical protein Tsubulata_024423 [Turnera subulata]|uniref:Uncharacterized protein n=1 Tax=Turnera subulata TaxID=218843 RepID=A0A9Q0FHM8_9ROSI|nr:hypothetical protein Tsubulata_024423 [Turnera subulata]
MALSSAFRERLEHMERTRNQRLAQLQAEKELQANKSQVLESKLSDIRSMEQRCFLLDHTIASRNLKILALHSEINRLDSKYTAHLQHLRDLKGEVEELEEMEKEKERFYELKGVEMEEFRENVKKFVVELEMKVDQLRKRVSELKSTFIKLQGDNGVLGNSELADAEMRRSELIAVKESLERSLALNSQVRSQLQNQLQSI